MSQLIGLIITTILLLVQPGLAVNPLSLAVFGGEERVAGMQSKVGSGGVYIFGVVLVLVGIRVAVVLGGKTPLPPPEDDPPSAVGVGGGSNSSGGGKDEDELRGLKGQANILLSLQKGSAKCAVQGSYGIKEECSKYIECRKKGTIPATKYCPSGKFFDHFKRVCMQSSNAECRSDICPSDGAVLADPKDDEAYLKCERGVPMPYQCPEDQEFSAKAKKCVPAGN